MGQQSSQESGFLGQPAIGQKKQISKMATHTATLWSRALIYSEPESVFLLHGSSAAPLLNLWVLLLHKHNSRYEEI